ncbi:MAG: hypothetical protein VW644_13710 [Alphaproteobacteria bacterium]
MPSRLGYLVDIAIDGDPADAGGQEFGDGLADPAKTGDDNVVAQVAGLLDRQFGLFGLRAHLCLEPCTEDRQ